MQTYRWKMGTLLPYTRAKCSVDLLNVRASLRIRKPFENFTCLSIDPVPVHCFSITFFSKYVFIRRRLRLSFISVQSDVSLHCAFAG